MHELLTIITDGKSTLVAIDFFPDSRHNVPDFFQIHPEAIK